MKNNFNGLLEFEYFHRQMAPITVEETKSASVHSLNLASNSEIHKSSLYLQTQSHTLSVPWRSNVDKVNKNKN
jgi:hypothetical protein